MEGNVVAASRWFGAWLVLASVILVSGVRWVVSIEVGRASRSIRADLDALTARLDARDREPSAPVVIDPTTQQDIDRIAREFRPEMRLGEKIRGEREVLRNPRNPEGEVPNDDATADRAMQLLKDSESLRAYSDEFNRFWFKVQPSDAEPPRAEGGPKD